MDEHGNADQLVHAGREREQIGVEQALILLDPGPKLVERCLLAELRSAERYPGATAAATSSINGPDTSGNVSWRFCALRTRNGD